MSTTEAALESLVGLGGAKRLVRRLAAAPEGGPHAVLFYGPAGCGKGSLARALAGAWLCRAPGPDGACGGCPACKTFERGQSPDVLIAAPKPPSNLIRLAAVAGEGSGEEPSIAEFFRVSPLAARHRVAIVEDAERMNADAAHALLKMLEEPPPRGRLVLTAASTGELLPTILSRCLAVACELPSDDELRALFPEASEAQIARAEGSPGRLRRDAELGALIEGVAALALRTERLTPSQAPLAGETLTALAQELAKLRGCSARESQVWALEELALALRRGSRPRAAAAAAEAHRRVAGNGAFGFAVEAMFVSLATEAEPGEPAPA